MISYSILEIVGWVGCGTLAAIWAIWSLLRISGRIILVDLVVTLILFAAGPVGLVGLFLGTIVVLLTEIPWNREIYNRKNEETDHDS